MGGLLDAVTLRQMSARSIENQLGEKKLIEAAEGLPFATRTTLLVVLRFSVPLPANRIAFAERKDP